MFTEQQSYRVINALERIARALEKRGDLQLMASITDLDAAIAAQANTLTSLAQALTQTNSDVAALKAKVDAGQPVDVSAELTAIQANTTAISNALSQVQSIDSTATSVSAGGTASSSTPVSTSQPPASGAASGTASSSAPAAS